MFYFKTKDAALAFAEKRDHYRFIDLGEDAPEGRRYAVKVIASEE